MERGDEREEDSSRADHFFIRLRVCEDISGKVRLLALSEV